MKDGDLTKNLPKMDADGKLKLDDELKDSLTNVDIFEKLTEITGDKIHIQEGQKYKPETDNSKNGPDVLIHEKVSELGIVASNKNKLTWIDDFTAKLDLQGHPDAHGVEIECEMDKITVLTSSPTNLCFVEKLKTPLTTDQVDRVKVKFKKKAQFVLISFPEN